MRCYTCGGEVKPEYSVVFRWWEDVRVHHPSCIQTFEVGRAPKSMVTQGELLPPDGAFEPVEKERNA